MASDARARQSLAQGTASWRDPDNILAAGGTAVPDGSAGRRLGPDPVAAAVASRAATGPGAGAGCAGHNAWAGIPVLDGGGQAGAGDVSVRRYEIHLLALCRQADRRSALDRLGLWQFRVRIPPALHGRQGPQSRHGADRVQPGSPSQRIPLLGGGGRPGPHARHGADGGGACCGDWVGPVGSRGRRYWRW